MSDDQKSCAKEECAERQECVGRSDGGAREKMRGEKQMARRTRQGGRGGNGRAAVASAPAGHGPPARPRKRSRPATTAVCQRKKRQQLPHVDMQLHATKALQTDTLGAQLAAAT